MQFISIQTIGIVQMQMLYMMYEILKYMLILFKKYKNEDIKSYQLKV